MNSLSDWTAIISVAFGGISLLLGGGLVTQVISARRNSRELREQKEEQERQRYRNILENSLEPFSGILKQTRIYFDDIREGSIPELLEMLPSALQDYYSSLPAGDSRKPLWQVYIKRLQMENGRAVELIDRFYGQIVLADFKRACDSYKTHVSKWEDLWSIVFGSGSIPVSEDEGGILTAPQFPVELEPALDAEMDEVGKRAGVGQRRQGADG